MCFLSAASPYRDLTPACTSAAVPPPYRRGVRFQGDHWQARTKRNGKEMSLGLYASGEQAAMAYDIDRLQQQGGKAQRLNFPLLRQHYKTILADLAGAAGGRGAVVCGVAGDAGWSLLGHWLVCNAAVSWHTRMPRRAERHPRMECSPRPPPTPPPRPHH